MNFLSTCFPQAGQFHAPAGPSDRCGGEALWACSLTGRACCGRESWAPCLGWKETVCGDLATLPPPFFPLLATPPPTTATISAIAAKTNTGRGPISWNRSCYTSFFSSSSTAFSVPTFTLTNAASLHTPWSSWTFNVMLWVPVERAA